MRIPTHIRADFKHAHPHGTPVHGSRPPSDRNGGGPFPENPALPRE